MLQRLFHSRVGLSLRELADEAKVDAKTVRRDLDRFKSIGFPITDTVDGSGVRRWRTDGASRLPSLDFTNDEAFVLYLANKLSDPLAGTSLAESVDNAFAKLRATLDSRVADYVDQLAVAIHTTTPGKTQYTGDPETLDTLQMAIEESRIVHITYQSLGATEPSTRDVYPYGLTLHKGAIYILAFSPEHDQLRTYKLDRISAIEPTQLRFNKPADFNLADLYSNSFGVFQGKDLTNVKVSFRPAVARYVSERQWHASQTLAPQPDGSLLATFELNSTVEIKSWLLSFGENAIILEPASLREEIVATIEKLAASYRQEPAQTINPTHTQPATTRPQSAISKKGKKHA